MSTKKVEFNGNTYNVTFNMAVEIKYEELSGQPFDLQHMDTQKATMQLCYASMLIANSELPFTFDELKENVNVKEWIAMKQTVIDAMTEWFEVPAVMQEEVPAEEEKEGNHPKN